MALLLQQAPTSKIPNGLEEKILMAVYAEQKRSAVFANHLRQFGLAVFSSLSIVSVIALFLSLTQSGFQTMATTIIENYNSLPLSNAFMALLETLPIGMLTLTLGTITLLCILLSIKKPKTINHNFTLALHV